MAAVKAAPFVPTELARKLEAAARSAGFQVFEFGRAITCPLLGLIRRTPGPRPRIYLSAGIHGDEPAPPLAVLELLTEGFFDGRADWITCPLLNPAGFVAGTRENAGGVDLNRDYRKTRSEEVAAHIRWLRRLPNFDLYLTLHEDWEATGFYLYEINPRRQRSLAEPIIDAVRPLCPIDPHEMIDERPAAGGIIRPDADPATRELWPESIYLRAHHSARGYTLETPSSLPMEARVNAQKAAVRTAVGEFLGSAGSSGGPRAAGR